MANVAVSYCSMECVSVDCGEMDFDGDSQRNYTRTSICTVYSYFEVCDLLRLCTNYTKIAYCFKAFTFSSLIVLYSYIHQKCRCTSNYKIYLSIKNYVYKYNLSESITSQ